MARSGKTVMCLLILLAGISASQTVIAQENSPIVAVTHWPPWKIIKGDHFEGIDVSILEALGNRLNVNFQYIECPWNRCLELIRSGEADIIPGIAKQTDREEYMYFISPPYKELFSTAFYTRKGQKGQPHPIQRYEDLYNLEVGMIRGGVYFDRFDKDPKITRIEVTKEIQLLSMLDKGRLDVIIGNDLNIEYLIHTRGFSGKFDKAPFTVESYTPTYIAISKKSKFIDIIPLMEVSLKNMVESGEIEEIGQTYQKKIKIDQ